MRGQSERLRVKLFGRFQVWRPGSQVPIQNWGRKKTQHLLKILVQDRGRVFTQDQLVELLFADLEPQKAIQNLHGRISELRRILEPELTRGAASSYIQSAGKGRYFFTESTSCFVDVEEFEQLVLRGERLHNSRRWLALTETLSGALDNHRGEYLEEDVYEEWTISRRNRLTSKRLDALSKLSEAYAQTQFVRKALHCCDEILSIDAHHEWAFQQKMRILYEHGDKAKAIEVYQDCVRLFKQDLGVEPTRETEQLYRAICENGLPSPGNGARRGSFHRAIGQNRALSNSPPPAQVAYQRGQYFLNRQSGIDAEKAVEYFRKAISIDSAYAPAHSGLASALCLKGWFNVASVREMHSKARCAINRALLLDEHLAEAHVALAYIKMNYEWDGDGAYLDLLRALDLDPGNALAYRCIAGLMAVRANFPDAIAHIEKAYERNPISFSISIPRAWIYYLAGQYEDVVNACNEILELDPNLIRARSLLGLAHEQLGNGDEAQAQLRRALKLSHGNAIQVADLAHYYGQSGDEERAAGLLDSLSHFETSSINLQRALVHTSLKHADRAVESLRVSWDARSWNSIFAHTDPRFRVLESYAPYVELQDEIRAY